MKKILITGANSYIGTSFERFISENYADSYSVDTINMIDDSWRNYSFDYYDVVFHVAGIVHIKETVQNGELYYKINRDLSAEVAKKAKRSGVKQFIYLSSVSVYGMDTGVIRNDTPTQPINNYGKSKLEGEKEIGSLRDQSFSVVVIRAPMVYGRDCRGNFTKIVSLVNRYPLFPKIKNKRSMIYIDNLSSFIQLVIQKNLNGVFHPQNIELMCTSQMVEWISEKQRKRVFQSYLLGLMVLVLRPFNSMIKKAFGDLVIDIRHELDYCVINSEDSVKESV